MAIGVAGIAAMVLGYQALHRSDGPLMTAPTSASDETMPWQELSSVDPRSHPQFELAYSLVCEQTLTALDTVRASAGSDIMTNVSDAHAGLTGRIDNIYARDDLWAATDPLVLEIAENIAEELNMVLDGSQTTLDDLVGESDLFRSLCEDWSQPL